MVTETGFNRLLSPQPYLQIQKQITNFSSESTRGDPKSDSPMSAFGVSQVLPVLVLCYYVPEGSILILEQPEAHLHPKVQSDLADLLVEVIKERTVADYP